MRVAAAVTVLIVALAACDTDLAPTADADPRVALCGPVPDVGPDGEPAKPCVGVGAFCIDCPTPSECYDQCSRGACWECTTSPGGASAAWQFTYVTCSVCSAAAPRR